MAIFLTIIHRLWKKCIGLSMKLLIACHMVILLTMKKCGYTQSA